MGPDRAAELDLSDGERRALGRRIATRRKELGLTQEQVAEALGVHKQTVWKWEAGTVAIGLDNLRGLAEHLRVSASGLLDSAATPVESFAGVFFPDREYGRLVGTLETMERWNASLCTQVTSFAGAISSFGDVVQSLRGQMEELGQSTGAATRIVRAAQGATTPPPQPPATPNRPALDPDLFRRRDEAAGDEEAGAA